MLMLGQLEKRLSRCTVPLPRPSKSSAAQWRRRGAETELEHNPAQGAEGVDETGSITARTRARSGYFHEKGKLLRAAEAQFFSLLPLPGSCQRLCPLRAPLVRDASARLRVLVSVGGGGHGPEGETCCHAHCDNKTSDESDKELSRFYPP